MKIRGKRIIVFILIFSLLFVSGDIVKAESSDKGFAELSSSLDLLGYMEENYPDGIEVENLVNGDTETFSVGTGKYQVIISGNIKGCYNTNEALKSVNSFLDQFDSEKISFIGINVLIGRTDNEIKEFLADNDISGYPIYGYDYRLNNVCDSVERSAKLQMELSNMYPFMWICDGNGDVIACSSGYVSKQNIFDSIIAVCTDNVLKPVSDDADSSPADTTLGGDSSEKSNTNTKNEKIPLHNDYWITAKEGAKSNNASGHNYFGNTSSNNVSYLEQNSDGGFSRVEYTGSAVQIEEFDKNFQYKSSKKIQLKLDLFGGYYKGEKYRYIVSGAENLEEDNTKDTIAITRYNESWKEIDTCTSAANNSIRPFFAGSLRMSEVSGKLCIHTSHQMYTTDDGLNHQANMTFLVDTSGNQMSILDSNFKISNFSTGYVSHSFNQFVQSDDDCFYRVDHGDAYPRSITLYKTGLNSVSRGSGVEIFDISGESGDNYTGVEVGGFEIAGDNLLVAANTVDQGNTSNTFAAQKNIVLCVVSKDLKTKNQIYLTNYKSNANIEVGNPHIVKASEDELFVMWEETTNQNSDTTTVLKVARINSSGSLRDKIYTIYGRLSDCHPIITSANEIVWYVTKKSTPTFYRINGNNLGQIEFQGRIDIDKCDITLSKTMYDDSENSPYEPDVTVKYGDYTLVSDLDYQVSYQNNYGVGTATVVVKGIGLFEGTSSVSFVIQEKNDTESQNSSDSSKDQNGSNGTSNSSGWSSKTSSYSYYEERGYTSSGSDLKTPKKVTIYSAKNKKGRKIYLYWKWQYSTQATGYQVQYALNKNFTKSKKTKKINSNYVDTVTLKKLKKKTYYIRIRAVNKSGSKVKYGAWSKVKKVKVKK